MTRSRPGDPGEAPDGGPADGGTISVAEHGGDSSRPGVDDAARPGAPAGRPTPGAPPAVPPAVPPPAPPRKRSLWRTAFVGLAAVGLVAGIAWALLGSKLLIVRSVVITGTHLVPASQVRAAAAVAAGSPMIRVNTGAVAGRVEAITQIRSATVSKSWPDRIVITVHERIPALAVAVSSAAPGGSGYELIDPSGAVVRPTRVRPAGLPLYLTSIAPGALRGSPSVAAAITVLHEVPAQISRSVVAVAAANPQDVTLGLSDRVTIVWGNAAQPREKAAELAILMRTHARYYDVSAPGTAVTR